MIPFLLSALMLIEPAFGISESKYHEIYSAHVMPYYESGLSRTFVGKDGVHLAYQSFLSRQERARLVVLPGRTEPLRKYAELVYDFKDLGLSIYLLEHRGQGESGRLTKNPRVQYVEHFEDYVEDLHLFIENVVKVSSSSPLLLLSHSMGGAIGSLYLIQHPDVFQAAVLAAPMLEINTAPFPEKVAYVLSKAASKMGLGKSYAVGQSDYDPKKSSPLGSVTLSQVRHEMTHSIFKEYPETQMGGVSYHWLFESLKTLKNIQNSEYVLNTPLLLLQAGDDSIVKPGGQNQFCEVARNCRKIVFPSSKHEILMERDLIRDQALQMISEFFVATF